MYMDGAVSGPIGLFSRRTHLNEYRITRVDTGSLTAVECTFPSLEAAEDFIRINWAGRIDQQDLRRIVEWAEGEPCPLQAWKFDPDTNDFVRAPLTDFYDHVEPA